MATRRFFVEEAEEGSAEVRISGPEFVHLKKVLRLKAGDKVSVFNGRGLELAGLIGSLGRDSAGVAVTGRVEPCAEPPVRVTLIQGLVKKDKPELIVEKATELGVSGIVLFPGQRSVAALTDDKASSRLTRLRKVAIGAAKQCGRAVVPDVSYARGLSGAIKAASAPEGAVRLVALEGAHQGPYEPLKGLVDRARAEQAPVIVLVGPEGGFTPQEAGLALDEGYSAVSLGPRTLRSETAAVALLSIVVHTLEDLGPV